MPAFGHESVFSLGGFTVRCTACWFVEGRFHCSYQAPTVKNLPSCNNVLADLVHSQKSKGPNKTPSNAESLPRIIRALQAFVKGTLCIHMLFCSFSCCPSIHCHINSIYSTITLPVPGVQVVLAFQVFLHTLASHWTTVYKFPILPIECTVTL